MREYSINVEENEKLKAKVEKLKAKVTDSEVYTTKLLKEKAQAEEQYLKEKQIITG